MVSKVFLNPVNICAWLIYLIDSNNHRNVCSFSVANRLYSLWLNAIICCDYQYSDVSYLSTTSTHCSECFVSWCIEEYDLLTVDLNLGSTNMLCNTARLTSRYVGISNGIEQRSLTVIMIDRC